MIIISVKNPVFKVLFFCLALVVLFPAGIRADAIEQGALPGHVEAERWLEAEEIFRSDPRWLGGDGVSSVDLGHDRVLWLFGDSLIDLTGSGSRRKAVLVRNTIAVQNGYDPTLASIEFVWKMDQGVPAAFFSRNGDTWYWPASGIMLGKRLLIFLMEIQAADNALGFESCGWKAAWIDNPQESPERWNLTWLISPQNRGLVVGSGSPILEDGFLQVFAADSRDLSAYLVRWPEKEAGAGILIRPQWWAGKTHGWSTAEENGVPYPIIKDGQMEFTVAYHEGLQRYLLIQTASFLEPCLAFATAPAVVGPWSDAVCFFTLPEQGDPELLIYAGKSHAALRGAEMVFSCVVNTISADRLLSSLRLYFPVLFKGRMVNTQ